MLIRRRPSVATFVAIVTTLLIATQTGVAAGSQSGRQGPDRVRTVEVTATDSSSVTITWPPSRDNDVTGYSVYVNGALVETLTLDKVARWRDRDALIYTLRQLACGTGYTVGVDTFDRDDRHSPATVTTVSTAACPDATAPSAPSGIRQVAVTETSVILSWSPSVDNVGVVEYGLYASGLRVTSSSEASATLSNLACGTSYLVAIDAADAAGNRSARSNSYLRTSPCPSSTQAAPDANAATAVAVAPAPAPPSSTGTVKQTIVNGSTIPGISNWRAVYDKNSDNVEDDPGKIEFLIDGKLVLSEALSPFGDTFATGSPAASNGQHTFQVRALSDNGTLLASNTVTATTGSTPPPPPPPPPSSTGTVKQTIVNGETLTGSINWRAVYDKNSDNVPDDPGSIRFLVDGKGVLTEQSIPFGDTTGFWKSSSVANGRHTFEVRALSSTGAVLAASTVSASVSNDAAPPAGGGTTPPTDTVPPSAPNNLRVTSATATSVTVAWNAATDNTGVAGYRIYRGSSQAGQTQQTVTTYSGLSCGTAYQVGISAYDAAGNTSPQATMSVTTSPCADSQAPTAPGNVTASTRTTTSIALTWAAATDNVGVAGYSIYNGANLVQTTAGTTGIVSGLTCDTNYTLAVDAFDATGNGSSKTTVMVSTLACADTTPPTQPTNLRLLSATSTSATIAWNASTDNVAVTGYDVYRAATKVGSTTTATTYTINGLACATGYTTGVRALDSTGNASTQATLTITTSPCVSASQAPATGFPNAANTGVPPGTVLSPRPSNFTVSTNNTVVDSVITTGCITVTGTGVTIKNSKVGCVLIDGGAAGNPSNPPLTIQDTEIVCPIGSWNTGIRFDNFVAIRVNIHGCENGLDMGDHATVRDSYIHDLASGGGMHTDGIQGIPTNATIEHNTIYAVDTSAVGFNAGANGATLVQNNLLAGGAYTLYCPQGSVPSFRVINNRFSTIMSPKVGVFGPWTDCDGETVSGNVYDSGLPLSLG